MKLSIVVPAYDEEATLQQSIEQIGVAAQKTALAYEVIVVDDGSSDGTWGLLERLASTIVWRQQLSAVRLSRNFGKEAAIVAGLQLADGDAVIVMDADLQHPPELIPTMVDLWANSSYPLVEAVKRRRQKESVLRRFSANYFYRIFLLATGLDLRNATDFKLLDRSLVDAYLALPEQRRFFRGLTAWFGLPTAQLDILVPEREEGRSKWSISALFDLARSSIIAFTALPMRLISWVGFLGFLLSVVIILQTLWNKWFGDSGAGFPTVIILILIMGSSILLSLGIIGEYLSEVYNEVKRRPQFIVREKLKAQQSTDSREQ